MAWQATLDAVTDVSQQETDSVWIDVTFFEPDTGRSFRQSLKIVASNFADEQAVADLIAAKVAELDALDVTADALRSQVGEVIS